MYLVVITFDAVDFAPLISLGANTSGDIIDITPSEDPSTRGVVVAFKHPTTADFTTGIELAVNGVSILRLAHHAFV